MRDLFQSIEIHAPIHAVWDEITRLRGVQRPLMDTVLDTSFRRGDPTPRPFESSALATTFPG